MTGHVEDLASDIASDVQSWEERASPAARTMEHVNAPRIAAFEAAPLTRMMEDTLTFQARMMECWDAWWRAVAWGWMGPLAGGGRR